MIDRSTNIQSALRSRQRGFLLNPFRFNVDPYFSNVSLLLHGDGGNGSTTIVDSSSNPKTISNVGAVALSAAVYKFGGSSIAFAGTSQYLLSTSADLQFNASDFTLEAHIYQSANSNGRVVYDSRETSASAVGFALYFFSGTINIYSNNANQISAVGGNISLNTWNHIAVSRQGTAFRVFVNGNIVATWTTSATFSSSKCVIGMANPEANQAFAGYMDEFRITKGVARYTANFTPPTAPFPNS